MIQKNNLPYREPLSHITKTQPYSIHKTEFSASTGNALYLHWHPEAEFFYLVNGELDLYIEDAPYHLTPGDAMFIPPGLLHRAAANADTAITFYALVFSTDLVVSPEDSVRFKKYILPVLRDNGQYALYLTPQTAWQKQLIEDLQRIFSQTIEHATDDSSDLLVEGLIRVIWQAIHRHHFSRLTTNIRLGKMEDLMQNVIWYIQQNYQEEISLEILAKTVHLSEGQLCRSFRQLTGSTPFTWLKKYRIMKSCEWLLNSDKKISEICSLCGFNNISYYNREFLKIMKLTPSAYRKLHEK